jgi:hypothetical protein
MSLALPALLLLWPAAPPNPPPLSPPAPDAAAAEAVVLRALAVVAAREPEVEALQRAAARVADRAAASTADFAGRGRWAALLPKVTAEYRHAQSSNRVVGLQGTGEVDYLRLAPTDLVLVRASWELPSLLTPPGELAAGTLAQARARRRVEAVEKVTALFFERRRLRVGLLVAPPVDPVIRADIEVQIARLAAEIDALTGGALTERTP